jgi:ABC-type lipoprotein export system ATPase subunit
MAETDGMVLVMGVTGCGKSTLVHTLKPNSVQVGDGLESSKTRQLLTHLTGLTPTNCVFSTVSAPSRPAFS